MKIHKFCHGKLKARSKTTMVKQLDLVNNLILISNKSGNYDCYISRTIEAKYIHLICHSNHNPG